MEASALQQDRKREIAQFCSQNRQLIDREAIELLERDEHWKEILAEITAPIISAESVRKLLLKHESKLGAVKPEVMVKKGSFRGLAKDVDSNFRIMDEYDVTDKSASEGKVGDFLRYFRDKYRFLSGLLEHRVGFSPKTLDRLKGIQKYGEVDLVGMVVKKWVSKNGNLTIDMDSPEGRCIVIVSKENAELNRDAGKILIDDVIGVKAKKFADEVVIANSFVWPDLMQRSPKYSERDLSVCLISDIHAGSKLFMEKEFSNFLSWINGNASTEKERERVGKIKYMVIAGDNVDGVGIYPDQFDELAIKDIYAQYDKFSELVKQVPEHIEIFICPGQHDAVRRADPQPAIPKEFAKDLHELGNVHFVGSPGWVEAEGLKWLIYHGASHHDMYAAMGNLDAKRPELAMIELLRRRDLSTGFGQNQPYVPESRDYMVIREEPDFYFAGDMHHKGYANYRGCLNVNAGCWQLQTEYEVRQGHVPTPGIALDINLRTRKITENNFYGGN